MKIFCKFQTTFMNYRFYSLILVALQIVER